MDEDYFSENELDTRKLVIEQNKKKKKSGGFQSMGLSRNVFQGIIRKGYKIPTPIQRKCIPLLLEGRDAVAMARTGSGKTATFLIPLFERLKAPSAQSGARALIILPTRELAMQTMKFIKELGRFTRLKSIVITGGQKIEDQFAAVHENPDIIVATPGRLLHVVVEMNLKLMSVEYVVFDEADRLFELGFQEQLRDIVKRLSENRQTLFFSATLPKMLVEFVKVGLNDPVLVRLDVDTKLNENLKLTYLSLCSEYKSATLLHLLINVINPSELTVVFVATKHHIEYLHMLLEKAGIKSTSIYSSLDQSARKINLAKFQNRVVNVMLVTDIAARGIDIPLLDNVINYHFPAKSKLFLHRVGRVARAGRMGCAYSLVAPDEVPFMFDLHLFLGRPVIYAQDGKKQDWDGVYGNVPLSAIENEDECIRNWSNNSDDLVAMKKVCSNGYKQYLKSRPAPSTESIKRVKNSLRSTELGVNPIFGEISDSLEKGKIKMLESMKNYRPHTTIFEINSNKKETSAEIMRNKRLFHTTAIKKNNLKLKKKAQDNFLIDHIDDSDDEDNSKIKQDLQPSTEVEIQDAFSSCISNKRMRIDRIIKSKKKQKKDTEFKDKEFYIPYRPSNDHSEKGLELEKPSFHNQAKEMVLDLMEDEVENMHKQANKLRWDRKKMKFTRNTGKDGQPKKILTESGVWIPASYKQDLYKKWKEKSRIANQSDDEESEEENKNNGKNSRFKGKRNPTFNQKNFPNNNGRGKRMQSGGNQNNQRNGRPMKQELKTKDEILKMRNIKAKKQFRQQKHHKRGHKSFRRK